MRLLGLVPARGKSRRLTRKNLAVLGGKTLVRRALETAAACGRLDTLALSSEDPEILREADAVPGALAVTRPNKLATAEASSYDVVVHALESLEAAGHGPFDAVALMQCTSPFTAPSDISAAIDMLDETGAESVVSVVQVDHMLHPFKLQVREGNVLRPFFEDGHMLAAEQLPTLWVRNAAIYVSRRGTIDGGKMISDDVRGYEMPRERSVDINTAMDLEFAEFLWQRGAAGPEGPAAT